MRKALQTTVRTAFYCTGFIALVAVPQLIAQALGAPIEYL